MRGNIALHCMDGVDHIIKVKTGGFPIFCPNSFNGCHIVSQMAQMQQRNNQACLIFMEWHIAALCKITQNTGAHECFGDCYNKIYIPALLVCSGGIS